MLCLYTSGSSRGRLRVKAVPSHGPDAAASHLLYRPQAAHRRPHTAQHVRQAPAAQCCTGSKTAAPLLALHSRRFEPVLTQTGTSRQEAAAAVLPAPAAADAQCTTSSSMHSSFHPMDLLQQTTWTCCSSQVHYGAPRGSCQGAAAAGLPAEGTVAAQGCLAGADCTVQARQGLLYRQEGRSARQNPGTVGQDPESPAAHCSPAKEERAGEQAGVLCTAALPKLGTQLCSGCRTQVVQRMPSELPGSSSKQCPAAATGKLCRCTRHGRRGGHSQAPGGMHPGTAWCSQWACSQGRAGMLASPRTGLVAHPCQWPSMTAACSMQRVACSWAHPAPPPWEPALEGVPRLATALEALVVPLRPALCSPRAAPRPGG